MEDPEDLRPAEPPPLSPAPFVAKFDPRANRLLATLDPSDFDLLAPHFTQCALPQGLMVQEQEAAVEQVFLPLSGVISLVSIMEDGTSVESALIGREGTAGAFAGLGPWHAFTRAVVHRGRLAWHSGPI
jgi:hypothetical protein